MQYGRRGRWCGWGSLMRSLFAGNRMGSAWKWGTQAKGRPWEIDKSAHCYVTAVGVFEGNSRLRWYRLASCTNLIPYSFFRHWVLHLLQVLACYIARHSNALQGLNVLGFDVVKLLSFHQQQMT